MLFPHEDCFVADSQNGKNSNEPVRRGCVAVRAFAWQSLNLSSIPLSSHTKRL